MVIDVSKLNDEAITKRLIDIAIEHCKLALEYSNKETTTQRKADIKLKIEELRIERDCLLGLKQI